MDNLDCQFDSLERCLGDYTSGCVWVDHGGVTLTNTASAWPFLPGPSPVLCLLAAIAFLIFAMLFLSCNLLVMD